MKKRIMSILTLMVVLLNSVLISFPMASVSDEVEQGYISETIEDGIKDMEIYEDKIVIITKNNKAIFVKNGEKTKLNGENYKVISKELVVNDEGISFNLSTEEYGQDGKYNDLYSKLKENYIFESYYILQDYIVLINSSDEVYDLTYLWEKDGQLIEEKKVTTSKTNSVSFDNNNQLYIDGNGNFSKYDESNFVSINEIPSKYNIRVFDENKMVLFNDTEYILVNNQDSDDHITIDKEEEIIIPEEEVVNEDLNNISNDQSEEKASGAIGVTYQTHVQYEGWQDWKSNGEMSGTSGKALRLEGIRIKGDNLPEGAKISYRTHIQDIGWQEWKSNGDMSGTEGKSKRLEGIEIKLENAPGYTIEYRVHVQDIGWQAWKRSGAMAGTSGQSKRLEGIEIRVIKDVVVTDLSYTTHVKNEGWKSEVSSNQVSGSNSSNRLEAVKINYSDPNNSIGIQYRAHVQNEGWQSWKSSGQVAGSEGKNRALESIEIKLVNAPSNYHVKYRVKTKDFGWQGWKQDGATAGTTGLSAEIIAIQIKIEKEVANPSISYQTHIQNQGWQNWKSDGALSGTSGSSLRLEAIKINLSGLEDSNEVMYRTHVQNEGWQNWVSNGNLSGTSGKGYRLEAIEIKLKNQIPDYELYYRVHVQDYGWQEWKKNGEVAGTVGSSKRLEAIEIKLVKNKNKLIVIDPGHNFGGDDGAYATHSDVKYSERDINMDLAMKVKRELEAKGYEIAMTRNPQDRETLSMRESLAKRVNFANNLNADFFISIHHNASTSSSATGVEAYYSSVMPAGSVSNKISKSKTIATDMVNNIANGMNRRNRKVWDDDFYVVKNTRMPSVLLEGGFITNSTEAKNLTNGTLQQQMAEIIANSINKSL